MFRHNSLILGVAVVLVSGCAKKPVVHDFSTPEGAILCLEDAYLAKDIEAAVRCKDFHIEARLMLEKLKSLPKDVIDNAIINKTAEVLELAFRKEIEKKGFPDMTGMSSAFTKVEQFKEGVVAVTEECSYPNGRKSKQRLLVAKTDNGWRVLNPID